MLSCSIRILYAVCSYLNYGVDDVYMKVTSVNAVLSHLTTPQEHTASTYGLMLSGMVNTKHNLMINSDFQNCR